MKTKALPAGDHFRYVKGARDSLGRGREFPPERLAGNEAIATQLLLAQAPRGVRPRGQPRAAGEPPRRPDSEWIRHNEKHHVHLISCYHEGREHVERYLPRVLSATEDLLLAGLPAGALYFTWFKHPQTHGTHAHGSLVRTLLTDGRPYEPHLDPELVLCFDRLVSYQCQFADPLDPRGCRPIFAGWASAKPANAGDIAEICETSSRLWAEGKLATHAAFLQHLEQELKFPVLVAPDDRGRPQRRDVPVAPGVRVPQPRHSVVVASRDRQRAFCLVGSLCHSDFNSAALQAEIAWRRREVEKVQENCWPLYLRFVQLFRERYARQRALWDGPEELRVGLEDLVWLIPDPYRVVDCDITINPADDNLELLDPVDRWTERTFPFAAAGWPEPLEAPEVYLEAELESLEEEMPGAEIPPSLAPPTPLRLTAPPAAPAPRPLPSAAVKPPAPAPGALDREAERARRQRRQIALATSLAIAQRHERSRGGPPVSPLLI